MAGFVNGATAATACPPWDRPTIVDGGTGVKPTETAVGAPPSLNTESAATPIMPVASSVPVTAALIGAATALVVTILKDFLFDRLKRVDQKGSLKLKFTVAIWHHLRRLPRRLCGALMRYS